MKGSTLSVAYAGVSVATGAAVAAIPSSPSVAPVEIVGLGLALLILVVWAVVRFSHRVLASLFLYTSALGLALPAARISEWMTVSDLCLLLAGIVLVPEIGRLRIVSMIERRFAFAVVLIVMGGLLGTFVAEDTRLSVLNLLRLVVAAGATLAIFALWAPSVTELRRFLALVVVSGLATSTWALTHATSNFARPSGFSGHPNHLALVALIAIGPALGLWLIPGSRRLVRIAASFATAWLVAAIVVSGSRSGLLGVAVAVLVAAALLRDAAPRAQLVIGGAVAVAVAVLSAGGLNPENSIGRTFSLEASSVVESNRERRSLFAEMVDQIRQEPLTGVGFADPLAGHGAYLQLWAAGGIAAFLGGLLVIATAATALARTRRLGPPRTVRAPSWPLFASCVSLSGLLVALTFQNLLWHRYIWMTVALVAASSAALARSAAAQQTPNGTDGRRRPSDHNWA